MSESRLSGKAAVVLGAETPAGTAAALALAEAGADVACLAAITEGAAALAVRSVAKKAAGLGVRAPSQAIDASIGTGVQVAMNQMVKELGRLDAVVCATDAPLDKPLARVSDAEWARLLGANLGAAFFAMRAAARALAEGGVIIAVVPTPPRGAGHGAYDATKAGVLALVRGAAGELAGQGVRVYALAAEGWAHDEAPPTEPLGSLVVRLVGDSAYGDGARVLHFRADT